jgi:indolepyruvate ferredoxin oxidoreductase beta subunit
MSSSRIPPPQLEAENKRYPSIDDILVKIHLFTRKVVVIEATELAEKAGNRLVQNSVMLGALAEVKGFPLRAKSLVETLRELVPKSLVEVNVKAFVLGRESLRKKNPD